MPTRFVRRPIEADTDGDAALAGMLHLLGVAMHPMLKPGSTTQPFEPRIVDGGGRSPLPEDFTSDQIKAFAAALEKLPDIDLKSRLADIVWLRRVDLEDNQIGYEAARLAVDAYLMAAAARERSGDFDKSEEYLERAIRLARLIDSKRKDLAPRAEQVMLDQ